VRRSAGRSVTAHIHVDLNRPLDMRVVSDPATGRGLECSDACEPGAALLRERPWAVVPLDSRQACAFCLGNGDAMRRCSRCKSARYCSETCQHADWKVHAHECGCLGEANSRGVTVPAIVRLALRTVVALTLEGPELVLRDAGGALLDVLFSLAHHVRECSDAQRAELGRWVSGLHALTVSHRLVPALVAQVGATGERPEAESFASVLGVQRSLDLFSLIDCNAFTLYDPASEPCGVGLFLDASLANHSCAPSAAVSFTLERGAMPSLTLRSLSSLKAGDAVSISYLDEGAASPSRRRQLQRQYCFECACERCKMAQVVRTCSISGLRRIVGAKSSAWLPESVLDALWRKHVTESAAVTAEASSETPPTMDDSIVTGSDVVLGGLRSDDVVGLETESSSTVLELRMLATRMLDGELTGTKADGVLELLRRCFKAFAPTHQLLRSLLWLFARLRVGEAQQEALEAALFALALAVVGYPSERSPSVLSLAAFCAKLAAATGQESIASGLFDEFYAHAVVTLGSDHPQCALWRELRSK
jgi:hypothetical protein